MTQTLYTLSEIRVLTLVFFASIFLSLLITPFMDRLAKALGVVDLPGERKVHRGVVTRMGGAAMALPFFVVVFIFAPASRELTAFMLGAAVVFGIGLADDKLGVSPWVKLLFQATASVFFIIVAGVYLKNIGNIFGAGSMELGLFGYFLTVFAMAGVTNSFNLSDGLDGLAAGMSAIACLFFIPFAYAQGNWLFMIILVSLLGVILGFLRFNSHPARLFMGDSGSLLLGFVMAASAISLTQAETAGRGYQPVTALIVLSLPVADTLYVMTKRVLRGISPFLPDKTHIHHRLMAIGFSHQLTVSGIYCFMLGMGVLAWVVRPMPEWFQFSLVIGIYSFLYFGLHLLEKMTVSRNIQVGFNLFLHPTSGLWQKTMSLAAEYGRQFYALFWLIFFMGVLFTPEPPSEFKFYLLFVIIFGLFFYPWKAKLSKSGIAHAVIFFGLYSLILTQNVSSEGSWAFSWFMFILSAIALLWTGARVLNTRRVRVLWPGSFEILLLGMAMAAPIILHYSVFMGYDFRWQMWVSFLQVVPVFLMNKAFLRRAPGKIRVLAGFVLLSLLIMII